jgi:hypothetical protein
MELRMKITTRIKRLIRVNPNTYECIYGLRKLRIPLQNAHFTYRKVEIPHLTFVYLLEDVYR